MKKIMTLFAGIIFVSGCAQQLHPEDELSRKNADKIASEIFANETKGREYIIFSVADKKFILVVNAEDSYQEYFYNLESKTKTDRVDIKKPNVLFSKMFNKNLYQKDYITFDSDFFKPHYEISSGNITYFVYKSNNQRFGEARLSFFIKPNPIDAEVYLYLTNKILEYNK